jgi:A/G-specific adenine glycosylase
VLRRAFAPRANFKASRGQQRLWAIAEQILPRTGKATWVHNQALMELGALVCTARIAKCEICPVSGLCRSAKARVS